MILAYFGVVSLVDNYNVASYLKIIGVLILLYLGGKNIYDYFMAKTENKERKSSYFLVYLLTVSNPFTILLWLGIFGLKASLSHGITILIGVAIWFLSLPLLLNVLPKANKIKTQKIISLVSGIIIIGFGIYFLIQ